MWWDVQASGKAEFEDDSRVENQSEAGNSLQRVYTIPEKKGSIILGGRMNQGSVGADKSLTC